MPSIGTIRNVILSTTYALQNALAADGWTNLTFAKELPDEFEVIFASQSKGAPSEVIVPVIYIGDAFSNAGAPIGIGDNTKSQSIAMVVFIFAQTAGQEKALRSFIEDFLADSDVDYFDFTPLGFPPSGTMTRSSIIRFESVGGRPSYNYGHVNAAIRFGGTITTLAQLERPISS